MRIHRQTGLHRPTIPGDFYLVATGISKNIEEFSPDLTRRLVEMVRPHDNAQGNGYSGGVLVG